MSVTTPLIVNFTPTGMVPTKEMTPHVPISVAEIVEQVHEAAELGITLVHLHARSETTGKPTWEADIYARIFEGIRRHCPDLVLCASLSGRNFNEFEKRSEVLSLHPDMGSLTLSSLNFPGQASVNSPEMIRLLAEAMIEKGVHPEMEVFDLGMLHYGNYLVQKGLIRSPFYVNIIAGNISGIQANLSELGLALQLLPKGAYWAFGGIGRQQMPAAAMAVANGGGVRIGLEDNIYRDAGRNHLATNIELVKKVHDLADLFERKIMTPAEFGAMGFYNRMRRR
ncbi:MAG TPA: 3-keto-5-aminohexanoate cleavage protein [Saprospiraceae bacterium]|nr:3-keto-5-aminohexanoate cleavage protein [Saprospiraceae bacterium]HPI07343.1 3-keto-5-aminohexanoate cleavage protein [Saprospiraceae bacterium]